MIRIKTLPVIAVAAMSLGLTSCGGMMGGGQGMMGANAGQTAAAGQSVGAIGQALIGLISSKLIPTENQIVGTWVYQSPAVVFNSQNALSSLGGNVASSGIEAKLQTYLSKYGITSGNTSITFNSDKTFTAQINGKTIGGTYNINGQDVQLKFNGTNNVSKMTPQLNNGSLIIAGDASKLLTFMQGLGANTGNSQIGAITSLMGQFNGMQLGIRMQKVR